MEWLFDPAIWIGLLTLVVLEVVLGIDNLVFIAILADKLPVKERNHARLTGLILAMLMRLGMLSLLSWMVTLTRPIFFIYTLSFSGRGSHFAGRWHFPAVQGHDGIARAAGRKAAPSG